jgi:hypothetical protein
MQARGVSLALIGCSLLGLLGCGGRSRTDGEPEASAPATSSSEHADPAPCPVCASLTLLCTGPLESSDATRSRLTSDGCHYESAGVSLDIECASRVACVAGVSCIPISAAGTITVRTEDHQLGFVCWPDLQ